MDEKERDEVFERIPWETLERKSGDKNWIVYAVAGAVVVGALAYSFTRNQSVPAPEPTSAPVASGPVTTVVSNIDSTPSTVASPIVVSEADLFAVDPERMIDAVVAHAELFAIEYMSFDGASTPTLARLLPEGIPAPSAPEGTQVYVDWARAGGVTETSPGRFEVDVLVRSLVAEDGEGFARHPVRLVTVSIDTTASGVPVVAAPPSVVELEIAARGSIDFVDPPEDLPLPEGAETVGGIQLADGSWQVVAVVTGTDGVERALMLEP